MSSERAGDTAARDDHGPVELSAIERALCSASADPGRYVGRGDNYEEPLYQWQVRAIVLALRSLPVEARLQAVGIAYEQVSTDGVRLSDA